MGIIELILVLLFLAFGGAIVVLVIFWLVRTLSGRQTSALEELEQRYARGEIDTEEFEERRHLLMQSHRER